MGARGSKRWGHHGGTRIGNEPGNESVATEKGHEMADLSPRDYRDQPHEAHGKEGVNGSSPLEGFLRSGHLPHRTHPRRNIPPRHARGDTARPGGHGRCHHQRGRGTRRHVPRPRRPASRRPHRDRSRRRTWRPHRHADRPKRPRPRAPARPWRRSVVAVPDRVRQGPSRTAPVKPVRAPAVVPRTAGSAASPMPPATLVARLAP